MVQNKAQFDDRIRNLLALAEDNSGESRTLLFSHICDLFLQSRPMESDNQIRMLIEIINELIGDVDISIRKELCDILLSIDNPPKELIKLMSEDVVEVSGRLLEVATIEDEQLLYLIKYASDEHREHIRRRFGLSPLLRRELEEKIRSGSRIKEEVSELVALAETSRISLQDLEEVKPDIEFEIPSDMPPAVEKELRSANDQTDPEELILNHPAPQGGPTTISDEWFWEIDRYGNIKYLSENAQSIFLQSPEDLSGEDFLCLWRRKGASENDPNDFIALFEKRQPFRDEEFDFEMAPGIFQTHLLSAIATFDLDNGRFTGFRGSAHLSQTETDIFKITQTNDNDIDEDTDDATYEDHDLILTSPLLEKIDKSEDEMHRPEFSGNLIDEKNTREGQLSESPADLRHGHLKETENQDKVASELLHNLSHEFRTPLNAIIGFSQMIDKEMWGPVSERYRKNTKNIINAANHLKEAVNNILDSAKLDAGLIEPSPESFSLKSVIQDAMDTITPILESKELVVSGIDDNIDVILYNDKHCIILCLIKIITFATRYANIGDELHISVLVNSNAQVRIEIPLLNQDIDEDKAKDLFLKTYNLKSSHSKDEARNSEFETKIASGFGLSVAQDIAKLIGGELSTMSEKGKISHVVLTISTYPA